jgi:hypothetical protein
LAGLAGATEEVDDEESEEEGWRLESFAGPNAGRMGRGFERMGRMMWVLGLCVEAYVHVSDALSYARMRYCVYW